jgi:spoIIIJ-associated protein
MRSVEIQARTVDEAVRLALEQLGKTIEEVQVEVLDEGSKGLFGLGGEEALVRVTALPEEPSEATGGEEQVAESDDVLTAGVECLKTLLGQMSVRAKVEIKQERLSPLDDECSAANALNITGDDLGILIGRRGETLSSLQYLVNLIVSKKVGRRTRLVVDVEGYRERRLQSLIGLAQRVAERVHATGQSIPLEAMPAYERRIIHLTLADNPYVETQSTGEEELRKVVVLPKS